MLRQILVMFTVALMLLCAEADIYGQQEGVGGADKEQMDFFQIKESAARYWSGRPEQKKPGFKQHQRWEWFARTRLNQDGRLDSRLAWEGWREKELRFGPVSPAGGSDWTLIGPGKNPLANRDISGLGRLNCVAFHPADTNTLWVGSPTGGLWKTSDQGLTWSTTTDKLPNLGISDILINPRNPDIIYIAAGDKQRGSTLSYGVMKSPDGGVTWNFTGLNPNVNQEYKIGKMEFHPKDPETILAATNQGIFKTSDGGVSWIRKQEGNFFDMEVSPADSSVWLAGRSNVGIYKSSDSGEHWRLITAGSPTTGHFHRMALAWSPSHPAIVYAVYCQELVSAGWEWGLFGVYRSSDSGESWTLMADQPNILGWGATPEPNRGQGGYALVLTVHPENPDLIYAGSVNVWVSANGGKNWSLALMPLIDESTGNRRSDRVHVDHHELVFAPGSHRVMYSCNDGGLHKSADGGETWIDLSFNLPVHEIYRLGLSPQDPGLLIVGVQDNGSSLLRNGLWSVVGGGDGAECHIDPNDFNIMYSASQFGYFSRTMNGGRNSSVISYAPNSAWLAPLALDPMDPATLLTASRKVMKSSDQGAHWRDISPELSSESLTILRIAPSNPDLIIVSDGVRLFKTSDGGAVWGELDHSAFPTFITDIAFHPESSETMWLSVGGYGRWQNKFEWQGLGYDFDKPKVFRSDNGGAEWRDVSGWLPNIPANCLAVDPFSFGVYVGTDLGVFYSVWGQGDWERFDYNLPNVIVTEMAAHKGSGKLTAATFGRGAWRSPLASRPDTPGIYPPIHFSAQLQRNHSLFLSEQIIAISWSPNPLNAPESVAAYRLYDITSGSSRLLAELKAASGDFKRLVRSNGNKMQRFALTSMTPDARESEKLVITVKADNSTGN